MHFAGRAAGYAARPVGFSGRLFRLCTKRWLDWPRWRCRLVERLSMSPALGIVVDSTFRRNGSTLLHRNFVEEVMRTGITRCVNGREEQPLRPCAPAGEEQVPPTGCCVTGMPPP